MVSVEPELRTLFRIQQAAKSYYTYSRKCLCTQLFYQQCSLQNGKIIIFLKVLYFKESNLYVK